RSQSTVARAATRRAAGVATVPVGPPPDTRGPAEVEIAAAPTHEVVAAALQPVELGRVVPALALDERVIEVDAWTLERLLDAEPVADHVDEDLEDRAPQP